MKFSMNKSLIPLVVATALSLPAMANNDKSESAMNDAWLDGKLDTVIILNEHLNPLKIETDVTNGVAVITGKVDNEVEKDLATELAKSVEGIKEVENRLIVADSEKEADSNDDSIMSDITDASITTAISTKLLLNTEIDSTEIDIDTDNRRVVINGTVESEAEKDLVQQIAKNTFEVKKVENRLAVK
ncbi:BON domain-containing protein [Aliikangiella sp. IMCC44653]